MEICIAIGCRLCQQLSKYCNIIRKNRTQLKARQLSFRRRLKWRKSWSWYRRFVQRNESLCSDRNWSICQKSPATAFSAKCQLWKYVDIKSINLLLYFLAFLLIFLLICRPNLEHFVSDIAITTSIFVSFYNKQNVLFDLKEKIAYFTISYRLNMTRRCGHISETLRRHFQLKLTRTD